MTIAALIQQTGPTLLLAPSPSQPQALYEELQLYVAGIPFYVSEKLPFRRAIWHTFVMAAAAVHYAAVLTGVVFA